MIRMQVQDNLSPKLRAMVQSLSPAGRRVLDEGAGAELYALVRAHFRSYALVNHKTADRLSARRTGHWEEAASAMVHGVDSSGPFVELKAPGIARAVRPVQVLPRRAKSLTIPVHALSYGRRVAEVRRTRPVFRVRNLLLTRLEKKEAPVPLYVLVRSAVLPQDKNMLPEKSAMTAAVTRGYKRVISTILRKQGASV